MQSFERPAACGGWCGETGTATWVGAATLAPFYMGWAEEQRLLLAALALLTEEQLAIQASPGQRPSWLLAVHMIGTRPAGPMR